MPIATVTQALNNHTYRCLNAAETSYDGSKKENSGLRNFAQ